MVVSTPAHRPVLHADRRPCTYIYETRNETEPQCAMPGRERAMGEQAQLDIQTGSGFLGWWHSQADQPGTAAGCAYSNERDRIRANCNLACNPAVMSPQRWMR